MLADSTGGAAKRLCMADKDLCGATEWNLETCGTTTNAAGIRQAHDEAQRGQIGA